MSNPQESAPARPQVDPPQILPALPSLPSLPTLVTQPGEREPRPQHNRGFYESIRDSAPDTIPDADYARILKGMPTRAKIEEASAKLAEWVPAILGQCSAHRQEIGTPRADIARDLEDARRELALASSKVAGLESTLHGIDNRTSQLKRHEEQIKATAEDLASTYRASIAFFDAEAELATREDGLIDRLAAIPEDDREPEDPAEEYMRLSPAQQLARQIRLISRTLKNTQLGFDRDSDLSTDYRAMIAARFGRPFDDCPRRRAIFGTVVREFVPSNQGGSIPTGRYGSDGGQIEKIERDLFTKLSALYAAFPALDPSRLDAEVPVLFRITAGAYDVIGEGVGRSTTQKTKLLTPSEAARINREYRVGHPTSAEYRERHPQNPNGPPRLTPEADIPAAPPIPIPAKRPRG